MSAGSPEAPDGRGSRTLNRVERRCSACSVTATDLVSDDVRDLWATASRSAALHMPHIPARTQGRTDTSSIFTRPAAQGPAATGPSTPPPPRCPHNVAPTRGLQRRPRGVGWWRTVGGGVCGRGPAFGPIGQSTPDKSGARMKARDDFGHAHLVGPARRPTCWGGGYGRNANQALGLQLHRHAAILKSLTSPARLPEPPRLASENAANRSLLSATGYGGVERTIVPPHVRYGRGAERGGDG